MSLLSYVLAACPGHPHSRELQSAVTDEVSAAALIERGLQGTYSPGRIGDRDLLIPNQDLRLAQRTLHRVLTPLLPPSRGVHQVAKEIQAALPGFSHYTRTDIRKCFPSVARDPALAKLGHFLGRHGWEGAEYTLLMRVARSLFPEQGLATGAPASPYVLEVLLGDLPTTHQGDRIFRYVDDLLILQSSPSSPTLAHLATGLAPLGLTLNPDKTRAGHIADGFTYLGRIFGNSHALLEPETFAIDCNAFLPMRHWRPKLAITASAGAPGYAVQPGNLITFRLDHLFPALKQGSLDALCLLTCLSQVPELETFAQDRSRHYSQEFAHGLHSRLFSSYVSQVKSPRERGERVDPIAADRVLAGLALSTYLQKTGRLPETPGDLETELGVNLTEAFSESATGTGAYHAAIKALFKLEHALRVGGSKAVPGRQTVLPAAGKTADRDISV